MLLIKLFFHSLFLTQLNKNDCKQNKKIIKKYVFQVKKNRKTQLCNLAYKYIFNLYLFLKFLPISNNDKKKESLKRMVNNFLDIFSINKNRKFNKKILFFFQQRIFENRLIIIFVENFKL